MKYMATETGSVFTKKEIYAAAKDYAKETGKTIKHEYEKHLDKCTPVVKINGEWKEWQPK